jgi:hypothetical protein
MDKEKEIVNELFANQQRMEDIIDEVEQINVESNKSNKRLIIQIVILALLAASCLYLATNVL